MREALLNEKQPTKVGGMLKVLACTPDGTLVIHRTGRRSCWSHETGSGQTGSREGESSRVICIHWMPNLKELDNSTNVSMTDLMAAVGEFLLCWGFLENVVELRSFPVELESIRGMRNNICHGLREAYANPWEDKSTAYVECRAGKTELVRYTFDEIHVAIRCLRRAARP